MDLYLAFMFLLFIIQLGIDIALFCLIIGVVNYVER